MPTQGSTFFTSLSPAERAALPEAAIVARWRWASLRGRATILNTLAAAATLTKFCSVTAMVAATAFIAAVAFSAVTLIPPSRR